MNTTIIIASFIHWTWKTTCHPWPVPAQQPLSDRFILCWFDKNKSLSRWYCTVMMNMTQVQAGLCITRLFCFGYHTWVEPGRVRHSGESRLLQSRVFMYSWADFSSCVWLTSARRSTGNFIPVRKPRAVFRPAVGHQYQTFSVLLLLYI